MTKKDFEIVADMLGEFLAHNCLVIIRDNKETEVQDIIRRKMTEASPRFDDGKFFQRICDTANKH